MHDKHFDSFNIPGLELVDIASEERRLAEQITEEARIEATTALTEKITGVSKSLAGVSNAKAMPITVFKELFLPMFAQSVNSEGQSASTLEETSRRMAAWLVHAGSYYAEVPIVDEHGNQLFRVPPLLNADVGTNATKRGLSSGVPGMHVLSTHCEALKSAGRANEAIQIESEELSKKLPAEAEVKIYALANFLRWNSICEACGVEPFYPKIAKRVKELDGDFPTTTVDNINVEQEKVSTDGAEADELF